MSGLMAETGGEGKGGEHGCAIWQPLPVLPLPIVTKFFYPSCRCYEVATENNQNADVQLQTTRNVKMKSSVSKLCALGLALSVVCATIPVAEAKRDIFIKKQSLKSPIPASFTKGNYTFKCGKWGDCGNYNIAF
jgi:hypothetical protein